MTVLVGDILIAVLSFGAGLTLAWYVWTAPPQWVNWLAKIVGLR